ncbi:hypothetical protein [Abyssalbus ytuae]|uniref:Energy transducer TonB n=1 Tax=Abyssalbus ytuae TaxID=2926907 RepID=A0A9E6ZIQ0_9FLAO|nr:hypothetical protein [Abyssalbus ytuae]UOB16262.1 hypothetical protein MQE35_10990 [Abyssalbus ytuae]
MKLTSKHLSFTISLSIMIFLIYTAYNIQLVSEEREQKEEVYNELTVDENFDENIPEEEDVFDVEELSTHMAYNEAVESRYEKELQEFKSLEELLDESKLLSDDEGDEDVSKDAAYKDFEEILKSQREQVEKNRPEDEEEEIGNSGNSKTTITYSLAERTHIIIENPVYTCETYGKVVLDILVDDMGNVVDARFNKRESTTSNGCLVDNAKKYAFRSIFSSSDKPEQYGTITYYFQGE